LSALVVKSKFCFSSQSKQFPSIIGQANLMLQASSDTETSDILIGGHFAMRAIPAIQGSRNKPMVPLKLNQCAGWLYLAPDNDRCIGNSVFYVPGALDDCHACDGSFEWQRTIFAPVELDPLLYIGSCRISGILSATLMVELSETVYGSPITVHRLLPSLWRRSSAGLINYQNQNAMTNTGSCLEVATAMSICNAASKCMRQKNSVAGFLEKFMEELGVSDFSESIFKEIKPLNRLIVPRMLFPCAKIPDFLAEYAGCVLRVPNQDQFDVLMTCLDSSCIRFEAKDRDEFSNHKLFIAGEKLFHAETDFLGVLVVRKCCDYWKGNGNENSNIKRLLCFFEASNQKNIRHIIFVRHDGICRRLELAKAKESGRCLLVIETKVTEF
jgi:hypothetical protein